MERNKLFLAVCLGLCLVAVGISFFVKHRLETFQLSARMTDLKGISLAIRGCMWESGSEYYPEDIRDKDGQPLLSWRVAILPYMERQHLYAKFHLDEPWNSPHNIELLSEIPPEFRGAQPAASHATPYQMVVGRDATFKPNTKLTPLTVLARSGTEYTFHIVESAELVPWTKPADVAYSRGSPLPKFGFFSPPTFLAIMASGSVFEIDPRRDAEQVIRDAIAFEGESRLVVNPRWASFCIFTENPSTGVRMEMHFKDNWK